MEHHSHNGQSFSQWSISLTVDHHSHSGSSISQWVINLTEGHRTHSGSSISQWNRSHRGSSISQSIILSQRIINLTVGQQSHRGTSVSQWTISLPLSGPLSLPVRLPLMGATNGTTKQLQGKTLMFFNFHKWTTKLPRKPLFHSITSHDWTILPAPWRNKNNQSIAPHKHTKLN